ncbi:hypothetical protein EDB83DRAFT_1900406 [Lactarius deliciosus]|nr:hypothetical protein EDB83DRAFT_1900406 [Lactarius deliciosus]
MLSIVAYFTCETVRRWGRRLNFLTPVPCFYRAFAISCLILFVRYPDTLIYTTPSFIMVRLSLCAFMSILNSRDHLRETLDGPGRRRCRLAHPDVQTRDHSPARRRARHDH